jgi:hypothetical protein
VRDYEVVVVRESDSGSGADLFRDFVCQDASPAAHFLLALAATIMFPRGLSGRLIAQHDWLYFWMLRPRFIFPLSLAATIMFPLGLSGRSIAQHDGAVFFIFVGRKLHSMTELALGSQRPIDKSSQNGLIELIREILYILVFPFKYFSLAIARFTDSNSSK